LSFQLTKLYVFVKILHFVQQVFSKENSTKKFLYGVRFSAPLKPKATTKKQLIQEK